jgi:hypothetical protein
LTVSITHNKVSGQPAGNDPNRVYGTHWDEDHVVPVASSVDAVAGVSEDKLVTPLNVEQAVAARAIYYSAEQSLTSEQQERARQNAGIWSSDAATVDTYAEAEATAFGGALQSIILMGYTAPGDYGNGACYTRVDAEPATTGGKLRSTDRYLSDGTTDDTDGGWWLLTNPVLCPGYFGAVGDGTTDDAVAWQNCLDFAGERGGGTVFHAKGYTSDVSVELEMPSDITITGGGCIKQSIASPVPASILYALEKTNITIDGIELDGVKATKPTPVTLAGRGIRLNQCVGYTITNCFIHDTYSHGINPTGGGVDGTIDEGIIANNHIKDCGVVDESGVGIFVIVRNYKLTVSGNLITDPSSRGIWVDDGHFNFGPGEHVTVANNVCTSTIASSTTSPGIAVTGIRSFTVTGNVSDGFYRGIWISDGQSASYVGTGAVTGNSTTGITEALRLQNCQEVVASGNVCVCTGTVADLNAALRVSTTAQTETTVNLKVTGNICLSSAHGIDVGNVAASIPNLSIENNTVISTASTTNVGISVGDTTDAIVRGNHVIDFEDGINILSDCTNPIIQSNTVVSCSANGIDIASTTGKIVGNTTRDNAVGILFTANNANIFLKDNQFLDTVPTSGTFTSTVRYNNYGLASSFPELLTNVEDQAVTGGFAVTSKSLGTLSAGNYDVNVGGRPLQHCTVNAATNFRPGTNKGFTTLEVVLSGGSAAPSDSGFTTSLGDPWTTTSGHAFKVSIYIGNTYSTILREQMA